MGRQIRPIRATHAVEGSGDSLLQEALRGEGLIPWLGVPGRATWRRGHWGESLR